MFLIIISTIMSSKGLFLFNSANKYEEIILVICSGIAICTMEITKVSLLMLSRL